MCGQFSLDLDAFTLKDEFDLVTLPEMWEARPHIFPSQEVATIKTPNSSEVTMMRWGLIPYWAKDMEIGRRTFNARSETLLEKPSFKKPFQRQRCLIPASGFYEWQKGAGAGGKALPVHIQLKSGQPFAFAGLWDLWNKMEKPVLSCTIVTCPANHLISGFHDRMPVILPKANYREWLLSADLNALREMLKPYPGELMQLSAAA
ncbi:MAG: SOS response-associated peptidase [Anaerolineaceae bacterium]|nr:SOS response-associated peptidase [Anaerolineaceae bacterium]